MASLHQQLIQWPKRKNLEPIFKSTQDALLFAHIIAGMPEFLDALTNYRANCYIQLNAERKRPDPNPQYMMDLAFRAQMLRECIEELSRIRSVQSKS